MATRILPVISPEHFQEFRALISSLPASFAKWQTAHVEAIRAAMRSNENLVEVVVHPDTFAMFLQEHRLEGSPKILEAFATETSTRRDISIAPAPMAPYRHSYPRGAAPSLSPDTGAAAPPALTALEPSL